MEANFSLVTRQDILNFPFPYKLWLAVNLEYCDFLQWNRDGTVILLDLVALEDYLNSTRSIFKIKNSSSFLTHLEEFQFERLNLKPEADEDLLLQYRNENFQRHRLDLLAKIRRHTYQLLDQQLAKDEENTTEFSKRMAIGQCSSIPKRVSERMLGDLCFMFHGGLSKIKKSRLRFQTILHFNKEKRILKEKLDASEATINCKPKSEFASRSGPGSSLAAEDEQVIELPVELFENPHDSVLNLGEDFFPEYAGYYGNCSTDQILHFFGEYLPMYEDGSTEVKKVVADNSAISNSNLFSATAETDTMQMCSTNSNVNQNTIISTPVAPNAVPNFNFSSNFEPIFLTNDILDKTNYNEHNDFTVTYINCNTLDTDDNAVFNSNSFNAEDDIAMEDFLKFNNVKTETPSVECQQIKTEEDSSEDFNACAKEQQEGNTSTFPQMPTSFKMKLNENVQENEANFRNFFSQYRASLNLLYDR